MVLRFGPDSVRLATTLLQRMRLASDTGGVWEAADIQWWSRQVRPTDRHGQLFWLDADDEPVAAVLLTDWGTTTQCDVLVLPGEADAAAVWRQALSRVAALGLHAAEFPVRLDDPVGIGELTRAGLEPANGEVVVASWLPADQVPEVSARPRGYRLASRADRQDRPHHLIARNGAEVADRLSRCSLYRPDLDLMVEAPDGEVAGYGLFWADPVTRVGLIEPMRTEQPHQGRGIARHILTTGLTLLAASGCSRIKVSSDLRLYRGVGFTPLKTSTATIFSKKGTPNGSCG